MHFGIVTRVDGCVFCCDLSCAGEPTPTPKYDDLGRRVYDARSGQFILVVEAARGSNGVSIGTSLVGAGLDNRPDLQIQGSRPMGDGSTKVCDLGPPPIGGGVPAIDPPSFDPNSPFVTAALRDFACRFEVFNPSAPCTITEPTGQSGFIAEETVVQFCDTVAATALFPAGETVLRARVRSINGETGPEAEIVIRVATPTPTPVD